MFGYNLFELALLLLLTSFCIFTIINRICACIEHCAAARSVSKMGGVMISKEELEKKLNEQNDWK